MQQINKTFQFKWVVDSSCESWSKECRTTTKGTTTTTSTGSTTLVDGSTGDQSSSSSSSSSEEESSTVPAVLLAIGIRPRVPRGSSSSSEDQVSSAKGGRERMCICIGRFSLDFIVFFLSILQIALKVLCWKPQGCNPSDCNTNGFCFGLRTAPICLCRRGFCGPLCQSSPSFPYLQSHLHVIFPAENCTGNRGCNGHGWSVAESTSFRCVCRPDWTGKYCENQKKTWTEWKGGAAGTGGWQILAVELTLACWSVMEGRRSDRSGGPQIGRKFMNFEMGNKDNKESKKLCELIDSTGLLLAKLGQ